MAEYGNGSAVIAKALCQIRCNSVRTLTQFAVSQSSVAANMCDCIRCRYAPVIDSLDEIH